MGWTIESYIRKGLKNSVADALSRRLEGDEGAELQAVVTSTTPAWLPEVLESYKGDSSLLTLAEELLIKPESQLPFSLRNGVFKYKSQIVKVSNTDLRDRIIYQHHISVVGGHSGVKEIFKCLKTNVSFDKESSNR